MSAVLRSFVWYAFTVTCVFGLVFNEHSTRVDAALSTLIALAWLRNLELEIDEVEAKRARR